MDHLLDIIQAPIIFIAYLSVKSLQKLRQGWSRIFDKMVYHGRFRSTEVHLEPLVNAGNRQSLFLLLYAPLVIDIFLGGSFQKLFHVFRGKRPRLKVGTPQAGTIYRIVNSIVLPYGSKDPMFNVV